MKYYTKLFHSKIARRIFILFVSCPLFPVLCLSIVSFIRGGWAVERVFDLITKEAGRQFFPDVLEAFLAIMGEEKTRAA